MSTVLDRCVARAFSKFAAIYNTFMSLEIVDAHFGCARSQNLGGRDATALSLWRRAHFFRAWCFFARVRTPCAQYAQVIFLKEETLHAAGGRKKTNNKTNPNTKHTTPKTGHPQKSLAEFRAVRKGETCETRKILQLTNRASNS